MPTKIFLALTFCLLFAFIAHAAKVCPKCGKTYQEDGYNYCEIDGTFLKPKKKDRKFNEQSDIERLRSEKEAAERRAQEAEEKIDSERRTREAEERALAAERRLREAEQKAAESERKAKQEQERNWAAERQQGIVDGKNKIIEKRRKLIQDFTNEYQGKCLYSVTHPLGLYSYCYSKIYIKENGIDFWQKKMDDLFLTYADVIRAKYESGIIDPGHLYRPNSDTDYVNIDHSDDYKRILDYARRINSLSE